MHATMVDRCDRPLALHTTPHDTFARLDVVSCDHAMIDDDVSDVFGAARRRACMRSENRNKKIV